MMINQTTEQENNTTWSALSTFFIAMILVICYLLLTGLNLVIASRYQAAQTENNPEQIEHLSTQIMTTLALDGDFNAINYIILTLIFIPIIFWFAKKGSTVTGGNYLGFTALPNSKLFWQFNGLLLGYFILNYIVQTTLGIETPQSIVDLYYSTNYYLIALIAVVICAPFFEEIFFRGFLFQSWQHSKLGGTGTIIVTSILFTLIHAGQYQIPVLILLSILAFILGVARYKSGGIWLPIYLHFANNAFSSVEMYLLMN